MGLGGAVLRGVRVGAGVRKAVWTMTAPLTHLARALAGTTWAFAMIMVLFSAVSAEPRERVYYYHNDHLGTPHFPPF